MVPWTCRQKQKSKLKQSNQPKSLPISLDIVRVNAAVASQQDLLEWAAAAKRSAPEAHTVKLECIRHLSSSHGGQRRNSARPQTAPQPPLAYQSEHHRTVQAEASAKLASDKLRGPVLEALTKVVSASSVRHLELGVKLSFRIYEQLGSFLKTNTSLEVLSFAGSCCGDQALAVILPALTNHPKIQVLQLPGCALTDQSATRLATLLNAQAAAAAQHAWVAGLRGDGANSSRKTRHGAACNNGASDKKQGIRVLDVSQNQLTAEALPPLASALADERSSLMHLGLAGNQLPGAETSAATFLQALLQEPPERSFTVDLRENFGGNLAGGADGAPTLPQLGVWAGIFSWNASKGAAVAAEVPRVVVQQRVGHHNSSSSSTTLAGATRSPAQIADRPLRPPQQQQQQRQLEQGIEDSTAAAARQQQIEAGNLSLPQLQQQVRRKHLQPTPLSDHIPPQHATHVQQQQKGQTPHGQQPATIVQRHQQQQSQEQVQKGTLQLEGNLASMAHTTDNRGRQHYSVEAAKPQQHHGQQEYCHWQQQAQSAQQAHSPASWDADFMDEGILLEGPKLQGPRAQQPDSDDRCSSAAASPPQQQNRSNYSSPEQPPCVTHTTAAKPTADVFGSEGLLTVIMQQHQMLEMLVQQQERMQQQQHRQQHGQQQHDDPIDERLLVQLAAVLNGLSEDVDQLEQLYHVSEPTRDKPAVAKAKLAMPPLAAVRAHRDEAKQRATSQYGLPPQNIKAMQAIDSAGGADSAADAAAFISRVVMTPVTASKAAGASRSPQQQGHAQQNPSSATDDDGVYWQLHSPLVAAEPGRCRGKQATSPRPLKPLDVDWHVVDDIGKQLYELHGLS